MKKIFPVAIMLSITLNCFAASEVNCLFSTSRNSYKLDIKDSKAKLTVFNADGSHVKYVYQSDVYLMQSPTRDDLAMVMDQASNGEEFRLSLTKNTRSGLNMAPFTGKLVVNSIGLKAKKIECVLF
jgi:uncharacterized protein YxeA